MGVGFLLYREIRDYAPDDLSSGELAVALMIADDANDETRRSWIPNELLCKRARLRPSGVKAALQKLAGRGLEFRVSHGRDRRGRPVYAVTGHRTDYRVPTIAQLIGGAAVSPSPVDNRAVRGGGSVAFPGYKGGLQPPEGGAAASQGGAAVSPLSSGLLTISSAPEDLDLDLDDDTPRARPPGAVENRRHMSLLEQQAWNAIGATHDHRD